MTDLEFAIEFSKRAHEGQTDKSGKPYFLHPEAVAAGVTSEKAKIAAYLHDTVEDTSVTLEVIRLLFGPEIGEIVDRLTHRPEESYMEYIHRAAGDPVAREIKISDLRHNMDVSRLPVIDEKAEKRMEKYRKAREYLMEVAQC